jgi:hypothetical protein
MGFRALVISGAGVAVITVGVVRCMHTAQARITAVVGAHFAVVAVCSGGVFTYAFAGAAGIARGAEIFVRAGRVFEGCIVVDTAERCITAIRGADLAIVAVGLAVEGPPTLAPGAYVIVGAGVVVIALDGVIEVATPANRVAAVVGAVLAVVAVHAVANTCARAIALGVLRARIAVLARHI